MANKQLTQEEKDRAAALVNPRLKTLAYLKSIGKEV